MPVPIPHGEQGVQQPLLAEVAVAGLDRPLDALAVGDRPLARDLAANMMREAESVAGRLGISFRVSLERRIAGAEKIGKHKTSMLQDLERNRPMEIDALVSAVQEMGELVGVATPTVDVVLALIRQRARIAGLY